MVQLLDLPDEILESVLICAIDVDRRFGLHDDPFHQTKIAQETISNIELVNRRLHAIVDPLRLRYWSDIIETKWGEEYEHFSLAVQLLRHPELRTHLHRLEFLGGVIKSTQPGLEFNHSAAQEDLDVLALEVETFELTGPDEQFRRDWAKDIKEGMLDAMPALILERATNVTELAVTIPFFEPKFNENFTLLRWLSSKINAPPSSLHPKLPLENLRTVCLRWYDTESFFNHKHAAPFFALGGLRSLYAWRIGHRGYDQDLLDPASDEGEASHVEMDEYDYDDDDPADVASGLVVPSDVVRKRYHTKFGTKSGIEELHLVDADLGTPALNDLISNCRRLRVLKIVWGSGIENEMQNSHAWGSILKQHAESLEVLELDFSESLHEWIYQPYKGNTTIDLMESLGHLRCLRELRIEIQYLGERSFDDPEAVNFRRLPPTLEVLKIAHYSRISNWLFHSGTVQNCVEKCPMKILAECRPDGRLPKLRTLDLTDMLFEDLDVECIVALKTTAKEQGVELKLKPIARWPQAILF